MQRSRSRQDGSRRRSSEKVPHAQHSTPPRPTARTGAHHLVTGFAPVTIDDEAQLHAERLLVAEAHDVADGWRFLTVDNLAPDGRADALLYEKALDAFDLAAGIRECRHRGRVHG